jgi:methionyl-tRNA synthetase
LHDFKNKQDVLRYTLTTIAPETKDADFTWADFQSKNNNELLAIYGNFVNRTIVLTHKYYQGIVPPVHQYSDIEQEIIQKIAEFPALIGNSIAKFRFREALEEFMNLARLGNKYLTDTEPWKKQKEQSAEIETILHLSLQICACLSILGEPFLPFTSQKLQKMLNIDLHEWKSGGEIDHLKTGNKINSPEYLFEKIEDNIINIQVDKLRKSKISNLLEAIVAEPSKEDITYDDFAKMDLRICTILEAEKVAKTKKLLKLKVDTGVDTRFIISGIAEYYEPEDIIGKQVLMLINLAPKEIKGIPSHGMILMTENFDGSLTLVQSQKKVKEGSKVK